MVTKAGLIVQNFNVKENYLKWCHSTYYKPNQQHKLPATHVCKKLNISQCTSTLYLTYIEQIRKSIKTTSVLVLIKTGSWQNLCTSLYKCYVFHLKKCHLVNWWKVGVTRISFQHLIIYMLTKYNETRATQSVAYPLA